MDRETQSSQGSGGSPQGALNGIKVLEWANFVAGPYFGKLMADHGAEVIKVESPGAGDESRRQGPFPDDVPHIERSALFLHLNTNKKSITLNLKTDEGRDIFKKLVREADILVEDNPPGLVRELGLDYETLSRINPSLIMTSITPFGQTGPYRDYKCYYLNTFHGSGFGYLTPAGIPDVTKREPIMMAGFLAEYYSGVAATAPTLASLFAGVGQHIDVSKQEIQFLSEKVGIARHCKNGDATDRASQSVSTWGGILPCRDGYALIGGVRPHQIAAFFDMMGNPDWTKEERFQPEVFHKHAAEAQPYIVKYVAEQPKEEIFHAAQSRGNTIAAVYTVPDILQSEHLKQRKFFVQLDHAEAGRLTYASVPFKLSETPGSLRRAAPLLGEHNKEIYAGRLGFSEQDVARMQREGTI